MFNGLNRGVQLIVDFLRLFIAAAEHRNFEALSEGVVVAEVWISETTSVATGLVKINWLGLAFGGADPWKGSRLAFVPFALKWKGRL